MEAALQYLEGRSRTDLPVFAGLYDDFKQHYKHRLAALGDSPGDRDRPEHEYHDRYLDLSRELLHKERQTILLLRDKRRIDDGVLREMEHELDLSETRLNVAMHHRERD